MEILKVSSNSKPKSVAGALAAVLREEGRVEMQGVGAGAVKGSKSRCNCKGLCSTEWDRFNSYSSFYRDRN